MKNKKYILTDETIIVNDHTLHRIQAIKDFGSIKAGDLGGFVEDENNLSQIGTCWVYDEACVYNTARIYDDACAHDKAQIYDCAMVSDKASVYDRARVYGTARVSGSTLIYDDACIYDAVRIYGKVRIYERACVGGKALIYDETHIHGDIYIYGDAEIYGKASISTQYDILIIPNIGSRNGTTTFFKARDNEIIVSCGCFKGTIDEFKDAVNIRHGISKHGFVYKSAIEFAKKTILF